MSSDKSAFSLRTLLSQFIGVLLVAQSFSHAWADEVMDAAKSRITGIYTLLEWDKDGGHYVPPQVEGRFVLLNGVIMTTNHKAGGLYLPPDDRRHYVAWFPSKPDPSRA